ncbi:CD209 antigen-like protein E [Xyrichtys novacula]|uniref:CD209 antigen-like protein E n=1 Tax=Xyrichtys novacula TaxID=13765 RepID=A0AAV1EXT9_XYRNO|nr:CD209 antigen-like protein E [Xyrichtys novacula]
MDESGIYINMDNPSGFPGQRRNLPRCSNAEDHTPQTGPVLSGAPRGVKKPSYKVPAMCLGLLCVLLLTAVMTCGFHYVTRNSNIVNLTKERDQLLARLESMTNDLRRKLQDQNGWVYFSGSLYYISSLMKSWQESRADCQKRGADLMVVNSREEQDFVIGLKKHLWIGLTDTEKEGVWKWVDGILLTTSYWYSSEPNSYQGSEEDCAVVGNYVLDQSWNDLACNQTSFWICEKNI